MNYPFELLRREATAIVERRDRAQGKEGETASQIAVDELPKDTIGLALSGGGIRCATFSLGILQALARLNRLRSVDLLSTVSGGSYTGAFLGRLFTRAAIREDKWDPCGRVQTILSNSTSPQLQWLRANANYILSGGQSDVREHLAVFWRNLASIYFILAILGLVVFGLLRIGGDWLHHWFRFPQFVGRLRPEFAEALSFWWWLPPAVVALAFVPGSIAYWLAPKAGTRAHFSFSPLMAWLVLLAGLGASFSIAGLNLTLGVMGMALLAIVWLESARANLPPILDRSTGETSTDPGTVIRNRLTRGLGETVVIFVVCLVWVVIDTLARGFAQGTLWKLIAAWGAILLPVLPFIRQLGKLLGASDTESASAGLFSWRKALPGLIAFPLAGFVLVVLNGAVHWVFDHRPIWGMLGLLLGFALSLVFGRSFDFLNYSSLQQSYAARLSRAFLGASNPARFRAAPHESGRDVQVVHPDDDLDFDNYHPEQSGGPLHLIGLCVNETVDAASQRDIRDRKGLAMCVSPCGVSVGRKFHCVWSMPPQTLPLRVRIRRWLDGRSPIQLTRATALRAIPVRGELFHVLKGKTDAPVVAEPLRLGTWTAISGAAFGTGTGRSTTLSLSLLLGLINLRLGYWWDSGLNRPQRPGRYRINVWRKLKSLPAFFIEMQTLLLSDFKGRFGGPSYRFWNISDGGHFDLTGIYELLRRRVPFIVAVDGGRDPKLTFSDMGDLVRQARIDFNAKIEFVPAPTLRSTPNADGNAADIPTWMLEWIKPEALGSLADIAQGSKHAALAKVTYGSDSNPATWIVVLKASLTGDETLDVEAYKRGHGDFPGESTVDQFFDEAQWESYRMLGEHIGLAVLA